MADGFSVEIEGAREIAADLANVDARLRPNIAMVVKKAATNIKDDMRSAMGRSRSFGHLARGISYDLPDDFSAEIGPFKARKNAKKPPRRGANIAYFGTSKGGGGVEHPEVALAREVPAFEEHLADIVETEIFG